MSCCVGGGGATAYYIGDEFYYNSVLVPSIDVMWYCIILELHRFRMIYILIITLIDIQSYSL